MCSQEYYLPHWNTKIKDQVKTKTYIMILENHDYQKIHRPSYCIILYYSDENNYQGQKLKLWLNFTGLLAMHSSSHFTVRSTEVLFLLLFAHAGTSSAKVAHRLGFMEVIISMYSTGLICKHIIKLKLLAKHDFTGKIR